MLLRKLTLAVTLACSANLAYASCADISGRVSIVGNEFPAIQTVASAAEECASDAASFAANLTADHQKINLAGLQGNPAEYTVAVISNSSIVALMNEDVVRPLDDLIAKHGQGIPKSNLITIDGKVMAVAFMANAQHLAYRKDVLEEIGVEAPKTYEELLEAAEMIREKGIMEYPVGGTYKAGWNLATEFINMYNGFGADFYTASGSAEVAINNPQGVATLEMMKSLTEYMNPDFLTHDSNSAVAEFEAGNTALMNIWGSRMEPLQDDEGAEEVVYSNTVAGGPMTVAGGSTPATALWWDGWTIAKNISDEDAEASFIAMLNGIDPSILNDDTMGQAVWMLEGYTPSAANDGVFASIEAGSKSFPMLPYHGLLHTALGDNLADYLQGNESAEQALADTEAAYTTAAKEKGFLN